MPIRSRRTNLHGRRVQLVSHADAGANPEDDLAPPPYSTTKVVNDLATTESKNTSNESNTKLPMLFSIVAVALSALSLSLVLKKK